MSDGNRQGKVRGFTFTETMGGSVTPGDTVPTKRRRDGTPLRFVVTILVDDLHAFVRDATHRARMTGTVDSPMFGGSCTIDDGVFNLFAEDARGRKKMLYRMSFTARDGVRYRLEGFKDVHNDYVVDVWKDTTTLFTTVRREDGGDDPVVATGVLTIRAVDLIPQVLSMRALNARQPLHHVAALSRFGMFFTGRVLDEYLWIGSLRRRFATQPNRG
jgi:cholesterol oxidase